MAVQFGNVANPGGYDVELLSVKIHDLKIGPQAFAQASSAPEQEAVAWMVGQTVWGDRSAAVRHAADRMMLVRPLYTHADDSGAALIAECWAACGGNGPATKEELLSALRLMNEVEDEQEQRLANQQALLAKVINSGALSDDQHEELETDICEVLRPAAQSAELMKGKDLLWTWFGLSYAAWLTLPRVLMHEMPDAWQGRMADLLIEWDQAWNTGHLPGAIVNARKGNKLTKWPEWLLNYRNPDASEIESVKVKP